MHSSFKKLKHSHLSGNYLQKLFKTVHIFLWIHAFLFFFSCDKCFKSLFDTFLTNASRLKFINCMLSIKTKVLLIAKAMCFSNPFGITVTFTSNLPISFMIK